MAITTALRSRGKYQNRGSGFLSRFITWIRLASNRCCSSACGIATLLRLIQSVEPPPKNRSSDRIGDCPSRSIPTQAGLPWRVSAIDRGRSKVKAAAWPPLVPTSRSVTAGKVVAVVALE